MGFRLIYGAPSVYSTFYKEIPGTKFWIFIMSSVVFFKIIPLHSIPLPLYDRIRRLASAPKAAALILLGGFAGTAVPFALDHLEVTHAGFAFLSFTGGAWYVFYYFHNPKTDIRMTASSVVSE
jgi:hypothetical protein